MELILIEFKDGKFECVSCNSIQFFIDKVDFCHNGLLVKSARISDISEIKYIR